jgi:hypothetical protein
MLLPFPPMGAAKTLPSGRAAMARIVMMETTNAERRVIERLSPVLKLGDPFSFIFLLLVTLLISFMGWAKAYLDYAHLIQDARETS